jgi:hypothetical protein
VILIQTIGLAFAAYGLARLGIDRAGWLAREGWSGWFVVGMISFAAATLVRRLLPGPRRAGRGPLRVSGHVVIQPRTRTTGVGRCTVTRQPGGWLIEFFDRRGDYLGKGLVQPYAGIRGTDSFVITDPRENIVGTCEARRPGTATLLTIRDRTGQLLGECSLTFAASAPAGRLTGRRPSPAGQH